LNLCGFCAKPYAESFNFMRPKAVSCVFIFNLRFYTNFS